MKISIKLSILLLSLFSLNSICFCQGYGPAWNGFYNTRVKGSEQHQFKVTFKNDSLAWLGGKIDYHKDSYFLDITVPKDQAVFPAKTKSIETYVMSGEGKRYAMIGIANDTSWLFKIGSGKINSYAMLAEANMGNTTLIQSGDGPLMPLTLSNLLKMVSDNPKASEIAYRGNFVRAIEVYNRAKK
jgi:hypothetical protein